MDFWSFSLLMRLHAIILKFLSRMVHMFLVLPHFTIPCIAKSIPTPNFGYDYVLKNISFFTWLGVWCDNLALKRQFTSTLWQIYPSFSCQSYHEMQLTKWSRRHGGDQSCVYALGLTDWQIWASSCVINISRSLDYIGFLLVFLEN